MHHKHGHAGTQRDEDAAGWVEGITSLKENDQATLLLNQVAEVAASMKVGAWRCMAACTVRTCIGQHCPRSSALDTKRS